MPLAKISWKNWRKLGKITRIRLILSLSSTKGFLASLKINSIQLPRTKYHQICRSSQKPTRPPLNWPPIPCLRTNFSVSLPRQLQEGTNSRIWMDFRNKRKRKSTTKKGRTVLLPYTKMSLLPQNKLSDLTKFLNSSTKRWKNPSTLRVPLGTVNLLPQLTLTFLKMFQFWMVRVSLNCSN